MKKLIALLAIFCLASMSYAANVIVVTGSINQTFDNIDDAFTAMAAGDTVDIQDYDGPLTMNIGSNFNGWSTLTCTAPQGPATILCNAELGWLDHQTVSNIIFDGQTTTANCFGWGVSSTVTNCTIKNFWWDACHMTRGGDGGVGATFSHCYFINNGTAFGFSAENIDASATNINKTIIDHCTIVNFTNDNAPISVDANFAGKDLSGIFSLRNSIVSATDSGATAIRYGGGILTNAATQVDEDYNAIDGWWHALYSEGNDPGSSDPVGAHSFKMDKNSGGKPAFMNKATEDCRLMQIASNARLFKAASDGTNIGADTTTVPVELSFFSAE